MKQISGKQFIRIATQHGWNLKRIKGSHRILSQSGRPERLTVPVHGNQPLKTGLLRHFLKTSGLQEADL